MTICENCGRDCPDGDAYCGRCGRLLGVSPPEQVHWMIEPSCPPRRKSAVAGALDGLVSCLGWVVGIIVLVALAGWLFGC